MAKNKHYAVLKGRVPGIYSTWDECKAQVDGFSGAIYKSFSTEEEANKFMHPEETAAEQPADIAERKPSMDRKPNVIKPNQTKHVDVYVDGSYNPVTKQYGCGIYMIDRYTGAKSVILANGPCIENGRNVEGEVFASVYGAEHAIRNGCKDMTIHHDYEGIAAWVENKPDNPNKKVWTANKTYTRNYSKHMDALRENCNIKFEHVYGHTGDVGNECVDLLAKLSCGVDITEKDREYLRSSIGTCTVYNHTDANVKDIFDNVSQLNNMASYAGMFYDDSKFNQIQHGSAGYSENTIDADSLAF